MIGVYAIHVTPAQTSIAHCTLEGDEHEAARSVGGSSSGPQLVASRNRHELVVRARDRFGNLTAQRALRVQAKAAALPQPRSAGGDGGGGAAVHAVESGSSVHVTDRGDGSYLISVPGWCGVCGARAHLFARCGACAGTGLFLGAFRVSVYVEGVMVSQRDLAVVSAAAMAASVGAPERARAAAAGGGQRPGW